MACHLFAWAFLALLCGAWSLARARRLRDLAAEALALGLALLPAVAVFIPGVLELRNRGPSPFVLGDSTTPWLVDKGRGLFAALGAHRSVVERALALATLVLPAGWALFLALRRRLAADPGLLLAATSCLAAFVLLPNTLFDVTELDRRALVLGLFTAIAALRPEAVPRAAVAAMGALVAARAALVALAFHGFAGRVADVRAALEGVAPGTRVLVVKFHESDIGQEAWFDTLGNLHTWWHLGALATLERGAVIPILFAHPAKQPIQVRPEFAAMATPETAPPPVRYLHGVPDGAPPVWGFVHDWRTKFDAVLVLGDDRRPEVPLPDDLRPVARQGFAGLYAVAR